MAADKPSYPATGRYGGTATWMIYPNYEWRVYSSDPKPPKPPCSHAIFQETKKSITFLLDTNGSCEEQYCHIYLTPNVVSADGHLACLDCINEAAKRSPNKK